MKTKAQILAAVRGGRESQCLDRRDYARLAGFFSVEDWDAFGLKLKDGAPTPVAKRLTKANILKQLMVDVAFGFEKALSQRGISAALMYEVVKMWLWILDDDLQYIDAYAMYGLPLFKAVALKYGFENPIGTDSGSEPKYDSE